MLADVKQNHNIFEQIILQARINPGFLSLRPGLNIIKLQVLSIIIYYSDDVDNFIIYKSSVLSKEKGAGEE